MRNPPSAPNVLLTWCVVALAVTCLADSARGQQQVVYSYDSQVLEQDDAMLLYDVVTGSFIPFDSRRATDGLFRDVAISDGMAFCTYDATVATEIDELVIHDLVYEPPEPPPPPLFYGIAGTDGSFGPIGTGEGMVLVSYDSNVAAVWDVMEVYDVATGASVEIDNSPFPTEGSFGHAAAGGGKVFYSYNSTLVGSADWMTAYDLTSGEKTDICFDAGGSFGHVAAGDGAAAFSYDSTIATGYDLMIMHNIADGTQHEIDFGSQFGTDGSFGQVVVSNGKVFYTYNSTVADADDRMMVYDFVNDPSPIIQLPGLEGSFGDVTIGGGKVFFAHDSTSAVRPDSIMAYDIASESLQTIDDTFGWSGSFGSIAAGQQRAFYTYDNSAADDALLVYDVTLETSEVIDSDSGANGEFGPLTVISALTGAASGNWSAAATWGQATVVPTVGYSTLVAAHRVTVAQNGVAFSLAIDADGTVDVRSDAVLWIARSLTVADGATLAGDGTVNAETITIEGTVAPGGAAGGTGTLTLAYGDMVLTTTAVYDAEVSLADTVPGADLIEVSAPGRVLLGGTLQVTGIDRTDAVLPGDVWRTIVHSATGTIGDNESGTGLTFGSVAPDPENDTISHHVGQGAFLREVKYVENSDDPPLTTGVDLKLLIALAGDVDGDRLIGLDDWDTFRSNFGESEADWTEGNFDSWSDGTVDLDDWDRFRNNFGQTYAGGAASGAAAVPEPGTIVMLLGALAVLGWRRRRAA